MQRDAPIIHVFKKHPMCSLFNRNWVWNVNERYDDAIDAPPLRRTKALETEAIVAIWSCCLCMIVNANEDSLTLRIWWVFFPWNNQIIAQYRQPYPPHDAENKWWDGAFYSRRVITMVYILLYCTRYVVQRKDDSDRSNNICIDDIESLFILCQLREFTCANY